MRTRYITIDWQKARVRDPKGTMIRLAMSVNDLLTTQYLFLRAKERQSVDPDYIQSAILVYSMRMTLSHLLEGTAVLGEVLKSPSLRRYPNQLSEEGRRILAELEQMFEGGSARGQFKRLIKGLRDKAGFHYDESAAKRALEHLANSPKAGASIAIFSEDRFRERFVFADSVQLTEIVDPIWGSLGADFSQTEANINRALEWTATQSRRFVEAAGELCLRYAEDCAA